VIGAEVVSTRPEESLPRTRTRVTPAGTAIAVWKPLRATAPSVRRAVVPAPTSAVQWLTRVSPFQLT
jgi:hypothetical protein